jgi:ABC-type spermidine/putrescine transport system permease subunit I
MDWTKIRQAAQWIVVFGYLLWILFFKSSSLAVNVAVSVVACGFVFALAFVNARRKREQERKTE